MLNYISRTTIISTSVQKEKKILETKKLKKRMNNPQELKEKRI